MLSAPPSPCTSCVIRRYEPSSSPCARRWWRQPIKQRQAPSGKRHRLQPLPSPRCAARASPARRHHRARTVRVDHRRSKPAHVPHTLCIRHIMHSSLVPRLRLHSSIHARPPGTHLQRNLGPPPPRSPSRRLQVVVRRGQRWWRQMPRGSSTRSSPRRMVVARRAQCPPSVHRMQVRRCGHLQSCDSHRLLRRLNPHSYSTVTSLSPSHS